eukprot:PhM_4_TR2079/c0_g1_i4/m.47558/K16675/ZDHHC9_14_18; palmitoyltransferase ZDHHC9/14/18
MCKSEPDILSTTDDNFHQGNSVATSFMGSCHGVRTFDAQNGVSLLVVELLPISFYVAFVIPYIGHFGIPLLVVITIIFLSLCYTVVAGSHTNPGILMPEDGFVVNPMDSAADGVSTTVVVDVRMCRDIVLGDNDVIVSVGPNNDNEYICRYCHTCRIVRPPRASHCAECNYCVREYDHHCNVLGICVGERTWRYFVSFLLLSSLECITVAVGCVCAFVLDSPDHGTSFGVWLTVCRAGLTLLSTYFFIFVLFLSVRYLRLTFSGKTGRDNSGNGAMYWDTSKGFPFDEGCWKNTVRRMIL